MIEQLSRRFMTHVVTDYAARLKTVAAARNYQPVHRFFEVASVDKAFFVLGIDMLTLVLQIVAAAVLLAFYHPILLSFTLVMVVGSWLVVRVPFDMGVTRKIEESNAKYALAAFLEESVGDQITQMTRMETWLQARTRSFRLVVGQQIGLLVIQVALSVALLFLGGGLVIRGELTLGQLVAAEIVAGAALMSLSKLGKQLPKIYDLITSFEKLGKIVDLPTDPQGPLPSSSIGPILR
jgi:ABC-type bacteriocin/lantibiotic exporter with double-glycine peptidase domain